MVRLVLLNFRQDPIISVWEHTGVRSTGNGRISISVGTSTWAITQLNKLILK